MEIIGLDEAYVNVRVLKPINIQWNRRYYQCGDFEVQLAARDYDQAIVFIYTAERPEMGMVEKIETSHTVKGDFVTLSGHFLEGMLNWKCIQADNVKVDNESYPTVVARSMIERFHVNDNEGANVPPIVLEAEKEQGELTHYEGAEGQYLGDVTYSILEDAELSQFIRYDSATGKLNWKIWQGIDRTSTQQVNTYAMFSQGFGNVDEMTVTMDKSAYRNIAFMVYANKAGSDRRTTAYENAFDRTKPHRYLYWNSEINPDEYSTDDKITAAVKAEGALLLKTDYAPIVNIEAKVLQKNIFYLKDYDLGDVVDVRDEITGTELAARIIEINEVWKENKHEVTLQFGNRVPKAYYGKGRWL